MSYSRWSYSKWYTYYDASSPKIIKSHKRVKSLMDKQIFTILDVYSFTYKQLRTNLQKCLDKACDKDLATTEERVELLQYMLEFMKDVRKEGGEL